MMKRISFARLALAMLLLGSMATPSYADTLWYNGDLDTNYTFGLSNQISPTLTASLYDDFIVPAGGWTINTLYSNNIVNNSTITGAYWEIRQGVSAGNGGTLLWSGTSLISDNVSVEATGRQSNDPFPEMTVAVTNLNFGLDEGTYWLSVTPMIISDDNGGVNISPTTGANAVGFNSGNSFTCNYTATHTIDYADVPSFLGIEGSVDFSMGIDGTVGSPVPLPPSILLLASALLALGVHGFRARGH
jgi:hypothetical protein